MEDLPDFNLKIRPGAAVILNGVGRMYVIESYEAAKKLWEESPGDLVEFTSFLTFTHTEEQVTYRATVPKILILGVDEWSDDMADATERDREKHKENCEAEEKRTKQTETPSGLTVVEIEGGE